MSPIRENTVTATTTNYVVLGKREAGAVPKTSVQPASKPFMHSIEEHAQNLRATAHVGPDDILDPYQAAHHFKARISRLDDIESLTAEGRAFLARIDARTWSGTGIELPNGTMMVVLNSYQTLERARVTFMEEIAHVYYGHEPSGVIPLAGGIVIRQFEPGVEQEAYWTAAATLLPAFALARAVWQRQFAAQIAAYYGCSIELVEFRLKTLGFWSRYKAYASDKEW